MDHHRPFPKFISHQGLRVNGIKNTIPAFQAAVAAKTDMIEMDIHETRDGHFIIYHDHCLNSDTPPWGNLTYAQVLARTRRDDRAPRLSDSIDAIGPVPVDLEIKSCRSVTNLVRALSALKLAPGSVLSSSNYELLKRLHATGAVLPLYLIVSLQHRETRRQNFRNVALCVVPQMLPNFLSGVAVHYRLAHKTMIRVLQSKGAGVLVWTVDSPEQMRKFILLGVDGIITNHLHRLQAIATETDRLKERQL
jgi:glycerophosphoryl diester phosphodiesterase